MFPVLDESVPRSSADRNDGERLSRTGVLPRARSGIRGGARRCAPRRIARADNFHTASRRAEDIAGKDSPSRTLRGPAQSWCGERSRTRRLQDLKEYFRCACLLRLMYRTLHTAWASSHRSRRGVHSRVIVGTGSSKAAGAAATSQTRGNCAPPGNCPPETKPALLAADGSRNRSGAALQPPRNEPSSKINVWVSGDLSRHNAGQCGWKLRTVRQRQ